MKIVAKIVYASLLPHYCKWSCIKCNYSINASLVQHSVKSSQRLTASFSCNLVAVKKLVLLMPSGGPVDAIINYKCKKNLLRKSQRSNKGLNFKQYNFRVADISNLKINERSNVVWLNLRESLQWKMKIEKAKRRNSFISNNFIFFRKIYWKVLFLPADAGDCYRRNIESGFFLSQICLK